MQKIEIINWNVQVPVSNATLRNLLTSCKHYSDYSINYKADIMSGEPVRMKHHKDNFQVDLYFEDFEYAIQRWIWEDRVVSLLHDSHTLYLSDLSYTVKTYIVDLAIEHRCNSTVDYLHVV